MSRRSEVSAGVLAYRRRRGLEVLLAHPGGPYWRSHDEGAWSIPKGVVESGDLLACARREFNEETGLQADGDFVALTPRRQKSGKTVHAFAIEADLELSGCQQYFRNGMAAALGQDATLSRSRPDRLFHLARCTAQDLARTAAVHRGTGAAAEELLRRTADSRTGAPYCYWTDSDAAHQRPVRLVLLHHPGFFQRGVAPFVPGRQCHDRVHITLCRLT